MKRDRKEGALAILAAAAGPNTPKTLSKPPLQAIIRKRESRKTHPKNVGLEKQNQLPPSKLKTIALPKEKSAPANLGPLPNRQRQLESPK